MSDFQLPPLNQQIADLLDNPAYDELIRRFKWELLDLAIDHERGGIPDDVYKDRRKAASIRAEQEIANMWREQRSKNETAHE